MNMAKLNLEIDTDNLSSLITEGGKVHIGENAEDAIFMIVAVINRYTKALEMIKQGIVEHGKRLSPDFKGIVGENVKGYIKKNDRYSATTEVKNKLPKWACKTVTFLKLDQKEIADYEKEKGSLPEGVVKKSDDDVISFVLQYDKERAKEVEVQLFSQSGLVKKS